jgi:hypothetical protein
VSLPLQHLRRLWPALIFLVALLLGLRHSGNFGLSNTEGVDVAIAHLHFLRLLSFPVGSQFSSLPYELLLHYWIALNGDGEVWIRFLSTLFAALAAVMFLQLIRRLFSDPIAVVATVMFVFNGVFVDVAQSAQAYSLALLLTVMAIWLFAETVMSNQIRYQVAFVIASVLAIYAYPLVAVVILTMHLTLLIAPRRPKFSQWAATLAAQIILIVPLFWRLATQPSTNLIWMPNLTAGSALSAANYWAGHGGVALTAVVGFLTCVSVVSTARELVNREPAWPQFLLLLWALFLPLVLTGVSIFRPELLPLSLVVTLPAMAATATVTAFSLPVRDYCVGAVGLVLILGLISTSTYFTHASHEDWRSAAGYVRQNAQAGDAVIVNYGGYNAFHYYFRRDGAVVNSPPVPLSPRRSWGAPISGTESTIDTSSPVAVARAVAPYSRIWLIYLDGEPYSPNLQMGLQTVFAGAHRQTFRAHVTAVLYSNSPVD